VAVGLAERSREERAQEPERAAQRVHLVAEDEVGHVVEERVRLARRLQRREQHQRAAGQRQARRLAPGRQPRVERAQPRAKGGEAGVLHGRVHLHAASTARETS
jgi:hypothetical protein